MSETKPSEPKPKKFVSRNVAVALGICIILAVSLVGVWYFYFSVKGAFNVAITDKSDKESRVNPDLPLNTFPAGEMITLTIWVNGTTNPSLSNKITLSATYPVGEGILCAFSPSQWNLNGQYKGFRSTLTIATSATTPQGNYTVTVIGTDSSGIEHQDSYSFSVVA